MCNWCFFPTALVSSTGAAGTELGGYAGSQVDTRGVRWIRGESGGYVGSQADTRGGEGRSSCPLPHPARAPLSAVCRHTTPHHTAWGGTAVPSESRAHLFLGRCCRRPDTSAHRTAEPRCVSPALILGRAGEYFAVYFMALHMSRNRLQYRILCRT